MLLLHGFTGCVENWRSLVARLQPTYDVIAVDLLGHGRTEAPVDPNRYQMASAARDIVQLLDSLEIAAADLLGYSMGGRLALYLAAIFPERWHALILESASPGLTDFKARQARQEQDEILADAIETEGVPAFVQRWEKLALFASQKQLSDEARSELRAQRIHNSPLGLANSLRGMGTGRQPEMWSGMPNVRCPTLLLAGELDPKFVGLARKMAESLRNCETLIIPESGHTIHLEQPEAYTTAVTTFLQRKSRHAGGASPIGSDRR